jgi:hypothetical protein
MKAGVIVNGTGAILVLTAGNSFEDPDLLNCLREKGMDKYIAFEIPVDEVKAKYGQHLSVTLADRKQSDACRVVDVDGARIFRNFPLDIFSPPISHDETVSHSKAA